MNLQLQDVVDWFKDLKAQGVSADDVINELEFDSDEYPDIEILKEAKRIVYGA